MTQKYRVVMQITAHEDETHPRKWDWWLELVGSDWQLISVEKVSA